jgi:capsular polysaccharide biosynthesis protein
MPEHSINAISNDEISLKDIFDFLVESWKTITLGGVAGGLLGLGYGVIEPPKYQATAYMQVAKVAGEYVEAPATVLEKLKMPTYYSQKTYAACNVIENLEPGYVIAKELKLTLLKGASIISISYWGQSPEDARKCLEGIFDDVRMKHSLLAKPTLEFKTNQIVNLKLKLESVEKIMKTLRQRNSGSDSSDSKFSASSLLLVTTLNKEKEIRDLLTQINDLEIVLLEPQTSETSLIAPIYSPKQKVSPNRAKIFVLGLIAGLLIGFLLVVGKRIYGACNSSVKP